MCVAGWSTHITMVGSSASGKVSNLSSLAWDVVPAPSSIILKSAGNVSKSLSGFVVSLCTREEDWCWVVGVCIMVGVGGTCRVSWVAVHSKR